MSGRARLGPGGEEGEEEEEEEDEVTAKRRDAFVDGHTPLSGCVGRHPG
jgi:hypothetical protein